MTLQPMHPLPLMALARQSQFPILDWIKTIPISLVVLQESTQILDSTLRLLIPILAMGHTWFFRHLVMAPGMLQHKGLHQVQALSCMLLSMTQRVYLDGLVQSMTCSTMQNKKLHVSPSMHGGQMETMDTIPQTLGLSTFL